MLAYYRTLREKDGLLMPAHQVELLAYVARGKTFRIKVRHVSGELAGFEQFVIPGHLRCPWSDWQKIERDERKEAALQEYLKGQECEDKVIAC